MRRLRQARPRTIAAVVVALLLADLILRSTLVTWQALSARSHLLEASGIARRATDTAADFTAEDVAALRGHVHAARRGTGIASSQMLYLRIGAWAGGWLPGVGPSIAHAPALLDMAARATAGTDDLLVALDPAIVGSGDILPRIHQSLSEYGDRIERGVAHLEDAARRAEGLRTVPWSGPFAAVATPLDQIAAQRPQLARGHDAVPALRQQFDTIAGYRGAQRILLLGQNEHEIRATGGFIGTMGMVTLQDGKIVAQEFGGSESFAPGRHKTPPAEFKAYYGAGGWFVRDANWWPDFPTSARAALSFVEHDRKVNLHAVVAIDTTMIGLLISHLGSIEIPEVTAPDSQRSAAEWRTERATLEYAKPLGPPGALLTATAGTDRHAFAYARPGAVKPGDRVQLSVVARAETARWMNFGDPSDTEWHASFFDLERGVAGGRVGSLDAVRIEPEPALGTGWYRATVAYTVKTNSNLTAWVEVAGGDGATGGFTASGTESIRFDQIRVTVNGTRLPPACNEGGGTDATWSAASGGTPCARPLAFPDPLTAANWLSQVESNFVAAPVEGRKQAFLQPVIEAILARVQESRPRDAVALIRAVAAGIEGRHLQAYYESSEVEALVTAFGADGRLHAPDGLEMLAVVDANISESKVQPAITRDVTYLRRADGNVDLVIRWTNRLSSIDRDRFQRIAASGVKYDPATNTWRKVPGIYGAYVRIILPAGATASDITGFTFPPRWHHEEGYAVISGFIRVEDGQSQRVIVTYQPNQQGARGVYLWKQGG